MYQKEPRKVEDVPVKNQQPNSSERVGFTKVAVDESEELEFAQVGPTLVAKVDVEVDFALLVVLLVGREGDHAGRKVPRAVGEQQGVDCSHSQEKRRVPQVLRYALNLHSSEKCTEARTKGGGCR